VKKLHFVPMTLLVMALALQLLYVGVHGHPLAGSHGQCRLYDHYAHDRQMEVDEPTQSEPLRRCVKQNLAVKPL
jgi:hypothetical protein